MLKKATAFPCVHIYDGKARDLDAVQHRNCPLTAMVLGCIISSGKKEQTFSLGGDTMIKESLIESITAMLHQLEEKDLRIILQFVRQFLL